MLKQNSKAVLDIIAGQTKRDASKAYKEIHPNANALTAKVNASKLLAKPEAQIYLKAHTDKAKARVVELIDSDRQDIALRASEAVLDRELGRPIQRVQTHSTGITLSIDLTSSLDTEN